MKKKQIIILNHNIVEYEKIKKELEEMGSYDVRNQFSYIGKFKEGWLPALASAHLLIIFDRPMAADYFALGVSCMADVPIYAVKSDYTDIILNNIVAKWFENEIGLIKEIQMQIH